MKRKLAAASRPETFPALAKWFARQEAAMNVFFKQALPLVVKLVR
jgi:hypothetical protein